MNRSLLIIAAMIITCSTLSFGAVQISPKKMFDDGMAAYKNHNNKVALRLLLDAIKNDLDKSDKRMAMNAIDAIPDEIKIQLASELMKDQKYSEAIDSLMFAVREPANSNNVETVLMLGKCRFMIDKRKNAWLDQVAKNVPNYRDKVANIYKEALLSVVKKKDFCLDNNYSSYNYQYINEAYTLWNDYSNVLNISYVDIDDPLLLFFLAWVHGHEKQIDTSIKIYERIIALKKGANFDKIAKNNIGQLQK